MSPTGDLLVTMIFRWGSVLPSLLGSPSRVASAWHRAASSTPFLGNFNVFPRHIACMRMRTCLEGKDGWHMYRLLPDMRHAEPRQQHLSTSQCCALPHAASQCSLHSAPIFRLLLNVAVKGTHQCDFFNFLQRVIPQSIAVNAARKADEIQSHAVTLGPRMRPMPCVT